MSVDNIAVYAEAYGTPEKLAAGFGFYQAFADDVEFFQSHNEAFDVPMLIVGGDFSMQASLPVMAKSYAALGAINIQTMAIADSRHWLSEEQPAATAAAILEFADQVLGE